MGGYEGRAFLELEDSFEEDLSIASDQFDLILLIKDGLETGSIIGQAGQILILSIDGIGEKLRDSGEGIKRRFVG